MYKKTIYQKEYESPTFWGTSKFDTARSYVRMDIIFDFKEGLRFSIVAPNVGFCEKNPFKAIFRLLEHESIGMAKYSRLKEHLEDKGFRKRL